MKNWGEMGRKERGKVCIFGCRRNGGLVEGEGVELLGGVLVVVGRPDGFDDEGDEAIVLNQRLYFESLMTSRFGFSV